MTWTATKNSNDASVRRARDTAVSRRLTLPSDHRRRSQQHIRLMQQRLDIERDLQRLAVGPPLRRQERTGCAVEAAVVMLRSLTAADRCTVTATARKTQKRAPDHAVADAAIGSSSCTAPGCGASNGYACPALAPARPGQRRDRHLGDLGDVLQTPGANAVRSFSYFDLLESRCRAFAEVALRHAAGYAHRTRAQSDLPVVSIGIAGLAHFPDLPRLIPLALLH